jgi:DNA polymerase IV (DinB-like DNA polymerase)
MGKPVIVGPNPKLGAKRGVVLTCSYEARSFGVRSAMPISQAEKLCPDAIYSFTGFNAYHEESTNVMNILKEFCNEIQQVSIDEAYLNVTEKLHGFTELQVREFSLTIQEKINQEVKLPISIGGSHTKSLAKICSQIAKPKGVFILPHTKFREVLDPLPLNIISGVGKKTYAILQAKGYEKIGDVAKIKYTRTPPELRWIWLIVNGIVLQSKNEKSNRSHSKERTFSEDVSDHVMLRKIIRKLTSSLLGDLKGENFRTLTLKIRNSYFQTYTRSKTFQYYINPNKDEDIKLCIVTANEFLNEFLNDDNKFRLMGIKASNFKESDKIQSSLLDFV